MMTPQHVHSDPVKALPPHERSPGLEPAGDVASSPSLLRFVWENRWWALVPVVLLLLGLLLIAALSAGNPLPYLYQQ